MDDFFFQNLPGGFLGVRQPGFIARQFGFDPPLALGNIIGDVLRNAIRRELETVVVLRPQPDAIVVPFAETLLQRIELPIQPRISSSIAMSGLLGKLGEDRFRVPGRFGTRRPMLFVSCCVSTKQVFASASVVSDVFKDCSATHCRPQASLSSLAD